ncbi:Cell division and transport-associated protein TolR [Nitrosococcus oceani ATCC 19707]|uniref:Tol-Pal system protein TolR n=2 Tax=Nitrosococcus oceani TaxID=1229 RepID=Q3JES0_NITOC|nr:protein TolR [Nitrosococcus oceani]ABA56676.1 Cell division and transport-associated protein TolR [Nitrosococcus oceani ATCC 19707]EDZ66542.1 protein TolR [Nitrosococcus oceani AFC27]KFI20922.1 biopolymer transporter TolR [Nitrosococcus oceani C-27]GEM20754.1 protein TolR [Nitrosococcus oceani]
MYTLQQRKRRRLLAEINVVPYIDVMLVLLVIFMITAPMLTQGVKVDLPRAGSKPVKPPEDERPLLINVDAQGRYYINIGETPDQPVTADKLLEVVTLVLRHKPDTPILIGGDRQVSYGAVVKIMALLRQADVSQLGLITEPPPPQESR